MNRSLHQPAAWRTGIGPARVLMLVLESQHISSCRLPAAFAAAGAEVAVLAAADSLMGMSRHVAARFPLTDTLNARPLLADLEDAVARFAPDLLVPCDERALWFLDHCRRRSGGIGFAAISAGLTACLTRSLGRLETLPERTSKPLTQRLARELGLRAPLDIVAETLGEARAAAAQLGYPVVVKRPRSCGASGVRICRTPAELDDTCTLWMRPKSWLRRLKVRLRERDWLEPSTRVSVQQYVEGTLAVTCAAALEGRTIGVLAAVAERQSRDILPADVLRYVARGDLVDISAAMVAAFGASGFVSFDFLIDRRNEAWLLECNARPTPLLPFGARAGLDLVRCFLDAAAAPAASGRGEAVLRVREEVRVALFPQALIPGEADEALRALWHAVPWDDPDLLRALLVRLRKARQSVGRPDFAPFGQGRAGSPAASAEAGFSPPAAPLPSSPAPAR